MKKATDCVRPKTTPPDELMRPVGRAQLMSDFFWRSCYDWILWSQNDAFVQIVRIDLQVLCTWKTICFRRIFPCSCKNNSLLILLEWSSLPNKNWGLKVKWKLFCSFSLLISLSIGNFVGAWSFQHSAQRHNFSITYWYSYDINHLGSQ